MMTRRRRYGKNLEFGKRVGKTELTHTGRQVDEWCGE